MESLKSVVKRWLAKRIKKELEKKSPNEKFLDWLLDRFFDLEYGKIKKN